MVDVHTVFSSYDGFEYCVFQNRDFVEIYVCVKILLKAMAPWVPLSFSRNKLRLSDQISSAAHIMALAMALASIR